MILILLTITLAGLKYFEFSMMEQVSWWWVFGAFFLTLIWFEVIERIFGLDKRRAHDKFDEIQKRRAKRILNMWKKK